MRYSLLLLLLLLLLFACGSDYTPKPRAFFKIKFPEKEYQSFSDNRLALSFLYPKYAKVERKKNVNFLNIFMQKIEVLDNRDKPNSYCPMCGTINIEFNEKSSVIKLLKLLKIVRILKLNQNHHGLIEKNDILKT